MANDVSHYGVIFFGGDPMGEHPDEELCGREPSMKFIACGSEDFCWAALASWTEKHPLRMWEDVEVLARDMTVVRTHQAASRARRGEL